MSSQLGGENYQNITPVFFNSLRLAHPSLGFYYLFIILLLHALEIQSSLVSTSEVKGHSMYYYGCSRYD